MENRYKVLLYGGGAREHALAWKISQSPLLEKLYLYNANDGFAHLGELVEASNHDELLQKAINLGINLLVVGPEAPLAEGIADIFIQKGIDVVAANKKWAQLESSKSYAKEFMAKHHIKTARYNIIQNKSDIKNTLKNFKPPYVIKADGLASGKGVVIVSDKSEAEQTISEFLDGKLGNASKKVLIEEFLEGEELSLIALWDGEILLPFVPARDYKRLLNGNKGPNTGGMGAYCPVELTPNMMHELDMYVEKLQIALVSEKADFTGVIYSGLIYTEEGLKVLEYNMRFGDPETQALMMHLKTDILELLAKTASRNLSGSLIEWNYGISGTLVIASKGYPHAQNPACEIINLEEVCKKHNITSFWAGVKKHRNKFLSNGGRILSLCHTSDDPFKNIYKAADELVFEDKYYRTDIKKSVE